MEQDILQDFLSDTSLSTSKKNRELFSAQSASLEKEWQGHSPFSPIPLVKPELLPDRPVNFLEMVELRTTVRQYSALSFSTEDLSYLLWCTQGVKMLLPDQHRTMRNVPSAGGRHALETYLLLQHVDGWQPGLYRYLPLEHALLPLSYDGEELEKIFPPAFPAKNQISKSPLTFIWTAIPGRMTAAFGSRTYRYLFLDAGHVCQNLYLAAETLHAGVCAIGAFDDAILNKALGIDGMLEFPIYAATVGKL